MPYSLLADLVVAIHVGYVGFVLIGQLLILVGAIGRWAWVRNLKFRLLHLAAIGIVVFESLFGITCPLTVWEDRLRAAGGETVAEGSFIGRCLHDLLFYECPDEVFTRIYVCFGLAVLVTFVLAPPRRRPRIDLAAKAA